MTEPPRKSFRQMREELAKERGRSLGELPETERPLRSVPAMDEDLIPDVLGDRTEEDIEMDNIINSLDILDAYRRWIGKKVDEKTTGQIEGIKVSCPNPDHTDNDPSAWLNSKKRTWFCGGCDEGGDIYDLAAIKFGYDRPGYKEGRLFHDLRREMAESYGFRFKKVAGTEVIWKEEAETPVSDQDRTDVDHGDAAPRAPEANSETDRKGSGPVHEEPPEPTATVTTLREEDVPDEGEEQIGYPTLNWRDMIPEDTFLWEYMTACCHDDSPEEYHFWHGLVALAHAVGRNVYLDDMKNVYGNMMVCLLGGTGYGKTRSQGWLQAILEDAVPYRDNGLDTSGCKLVPVPASGENLIAQFQHVAHDPSLPKGTPEVRTPVNGVVDYDEFAGLLTRAMRQGNTLKVYVQQFADNRKRVTSSSNTGGTLEAFEPFCSIICSTQPKSVRSLLSKYDTGSGFLNRWVFIGGQRKKRESIGGRRTAIHVDLSRATTQLKGVRAWGATERIVELTDDGFEEWDDWFHDTIEPLQLQDDTDLLPRIGLTMKRMMLLFAVNERKTEVDSKMIERIKPILDYLVQCYAIVNTEIGVTAMSEITNDILRHIKRIQEATGRGATARDLGQRLKRKNYSPDLIKKALETMVALDWIDVDKHKGGMGRPTVRYKVVS